MIKTLFSTPLGVYHYPVSDELRNDVIRTSESEFYNLWNDVRLTKEMFRLKNFIEDSCGDYISPLLNNYMQQAKPVNVEGKINIQYPNDFFPLHSHSHCHVASVYYVNTPDNCGDLLLVDPRGDNNWTDRVDGKYSNVSYEKITPTEGMLLFFPGYLMHMVEPNKSDKMRVSVITNFYMLRGKN